jgi:lipooligosaccharide transport system permease protein
VVERNVAINRHYWMIFVARLLEPFLFLFSIGIGVGALVGTLPSADGGGEVITYRQFVAPALVATAAMNASVFASAMDFFAKFKWVGSYASMLAAPITVGDIIRGELLWILGYVGVQSAVYVVLLTALGLVTSWWGLAMVPAALLVAFAFGGAGFVAASYLRSWLDFDFVTVVTVPLYLFSASFFPLSRYPEGLQIVVRLTPLYQGVDLTRDLALGTVGWGSLVSVIYLLAMGRACLFVAERRLSNKLRP